MLSIALFVLAVAAPAVLGPPAICFPLDIGNARSIPWGEEGAFSVAKDYVARVPADVLALLAESDDTLVHMETLRRAAIYLGGVGHRQGRQEPLHGQALATELASQLRARVIEAVLAENGEKPLSKRAAALRWFDLGYFLAALHQIGDTPKEAFDGALARAVELAPDDGALRLGVALGSWFEEEVRWRSLGAALSFTGDERLQRNLLATAGQILGCSSHAELGTEVRSHVD